MAAGYRGVVVAAIAALGDDGVIVSPEDYNNFEALIGEYFNESDGDSDESGSEDSECGKYRFWYLSAFLHSSNVSELVSKNHHTTEDEPDVFGKFYLAFTSSYYKIK